MISGGHSLLNGYHTLSCNGHHTMYTNQLNKGFDATIGAMTCAWCVIRQKPGHG